MKLLATPETDCYFCYWPNQLQVITSSKSSSSYPLFQRGSLVCVCSSKSVILR